MHQAIKNKDYDTFHEYVQSGLNDDDLREVVHSTDTYFIEYLINNGIDLHCDLLLFWASAPVIPILVKYGLDINQRDKTGYTALIVNIMYGYTDKARALINEGADPNCINVYNNTALDYACKIDLELVDTLLEHGACNTKYQYIPVLYNLIKTNKSLITDLTEQSKDLTMYRDFYELTQFEFCKIQKSNDSDNQC